MKKIPDFTLVFGGLVLTLFLTAGSTGNILNILSTGSMPIKSSLVLEMLAILILFTVSSVFLFIDFIRRKATLLTLLSSLILLGYGLSRMPKPIIAFPNLIDLLISSVFLTGFSAFLFISTLTGRLRKLQG